MTSLLTRKLSSEAQAVQAKLKDVNKEDQSPITDDDVDLLAHGHRLKSPLVGSYALLRDLAPATVAILLAFLVALLWMSPARSTVLVVGVALLLGLPVLLPKAHPSKVKAYDPLLMLASDPLRSNDTGSEKVASLSPPSEAEGVKHHVSLSTPHRWFARIRQLDLTPLIRVELNPATRMPPPLPHALHTADMGHLTGGKHLVVNILCGPRLILRIAKYVVGSSALRKVGELTGKDIIRLLQPDERYNFILAQKPLRIVLSHVGPGEVGGMYAKHALLAELGRVVFAGELWKDGEGVVHINNASGTYHPEATLLPRVRDFMHEALQIPVEEHERTDK
jgi:hypothetical protein